MTLKPTLTVLSEVGSDQKYDVSVIIPMKNCESYLDACLYSVYEQDFTGSLQVSIYDDGSSDKSQELVLIWKAKLESKGINLVLTGAGSLTSYGPGFAKNRAVERSSGVFLCFLDADDVMSPNRVRDQYLFARMRPNAIVGSRFTRKPEGSTERFTRWANRLTSEQLYLQAYTSNGPTLIMPTWFCSRQVFDSVGGFDESGLGTPEDLIFFYRHLDLGGTLFCVDDVLVVYNYRLTSATFSIREDVIWKLRVDVLQRRVLAYWQAFTVWNAGKLGRRFFRSLCEVNRKKVVAFCDVDKKKLAKGMYTFEEDKCFPKARIPIIHFKDATPPLIICVKLDLTGNSFECNLASLNLIEGKDYFHFG